MKTAYLLKIIVFLLLSLIITCKSFGQIKNIGASRVINYNNPAINAGTQTWMIDIGSNGLAYFANNDGVLEFDGLTWRTYPLPANSVVRSVKASSDGRIYCGGYNEFGYFKSDSAGQLNFYPLHFLLPEEFRDYGEVWKIFETEEGIIFQSYTQLMIYGGDSISIIRAPDMFHFSFLVNGELFINDQTLGLFRLKAGNIQKVEGTGILDGKLIWAMLPKGDDILIATSDDGIFVYDGNKLIEWKNKSAALLMQKQVYFGISIDESHYAFGTIQDGLIICDTAGNMIQHINIQKGLQNNTILSMHIDQYSNLWLGLDNGIDYVVINSPLTYFSTYNNLSSGYSAVIHNGFLYFGTNRGVFYYNWKSLSSGGGDHKFTLVPGTQGQVWSLQVIDGTLFCGHNSGIFIIEGSRAEQLSGTQGGWTFIQPEGRNDIVICGTYTYLVLFEKKNNKWSKGTQIGGFSESSRYIANAGPQSIWISHGYKGVFHVSFNETFEYVTDVEFYNSNHGFPSDKDIIVFEIMDKPVFTTGKGFYKFDQNTNSFVPDDIIHSRVSRTDMNILKEDDQGDIWYFASEQAGIYRLMEDGNYSSVDIPFRELEGKFIKWFQFVYPYDEKNVFFGTKDGFAHYSPGYFSAYQLEFSSYIRGVRILSGIDSMIFKGSGASDQLNISLPYKFNHLQFEFSGNDYSNPQGMRFLVKLDGFDHDWIEWQYHAARQFTNLKHGEYVFRLKAVNIFGVESKESIFRFSIRPPLYLSNYAYFAYFILGVIIIGFLIKYVKYRIRSSKKAIEEEQKKRFAEKENKLQIESLTAEKELIRLRNDKLRNEKIQKDKELANTTMQIIQKSKSFVAIKHDLRRLSRDLGNNPASGKVNMIIKKIDRSIDTDKQWEVFESHFESVHDEFLTRLKANYPDLSPRELKLCAYLRLNISSKEIANLMNISVRGVEISRYRVRKKLGLDHDTNLTDFVLSF